jgi:hypothetical protein
MAICFLSVAHPHREAADGVTEEAGAEAAGIERDEELAGRLAGRDEELTGRLVGRFEELEGWHERLLKQTASNHVSYLFLNTFYSIRPLIITKSLEELG